jgi:HTH-type transcriptional regulator/antitoxin HigA
MARIKDENKYQIILKRVEDLMNIVTEETPPSAPDFIELDLLADLAEEYEMEYYPIGQPDRKNETSIYDSKKIRRNLNVDANLIPA